MYLYKMNSKDKQFISEVYELVSKIEGLIHSYEYEDKVMSSIVIGILDTDLNKEPKEGDTVELKSVFSYNLDSRDELEVIKEIMSSQFEDESPDLDDLLSDLGISLN